MKVFRWRKKGVRAPDGTMGLMEHLVELRQRLFLAALGIAVGSVLGFIWFTNGVPSLHIAKLGDILIGPYCQVAPGSRLDLGHGCQLLATDVFSPLQIRLKAAVMVGSVVSSPVWLYQVWGFVTPALYDKERRFAVIFVSSAATLFTGGAVLAYYVISKGLAVLLSFAGTITVTGLDPDKYFSFLIAMLVIFGLSFELPLLLIMLNVIGVVKGAQMAKARRYAIFSLVVFAALVVPGNDPITMSALAVALIVLYEVAIQVAKVHDKRQNRRLAAEGLADLPDDVAGPLPTTTGWHGGAYEAEPVEAPLPVVKPEPVPAAARAATDLGDAT